MNSEVNMAKKEAVEFNQDVHGEELAKLIKEASDNKLKISGYNELIKDIRTRAKEELGVDGKMFNRLLALYHKDARDQFEAENEEVVELYDTVFTK